jgi:hypothetical protein
MENIMKKQVTDKKGADSASDALNCSADADKGNAERLADAIIQALREDGFDAFSIGNYYDISEQVRPIIIKAIIDNS